MQKKTEVIKGYMKKLKNSSFNRLFGNTNLRWFELDFKNKTFGYKEDHTDLNLKFALKFSEINDFEEKVKSEFTRLCEWQFSFGLKTKNNRLYIFFCQSQFDLDQWIDAFNIILNKNIPIIPETVKKEIFTKVKPKLEPKSEVLKNEIIEKPKEKVIDNPVIIEQKPIRKRIIINENVPLKSMNSSHMIYDQELSDFIDDVDKSIDLDNNYMSTNNLNKSYNSNNSQVYCNYVIDDWNYYDENGQRVNDNENTNKEFSDHVVYLKRRKTANENKKKRIIVENLHNNQALSGNILFINSNEIVNDKQYNNTKNAYEQMEEFIGDKQIIRDIAKADILKPKNLTNSLVARETIKKIDDEEARKERFNKHRIKSLLKGNNKVRLSMGEKDIKSVNNESFHNIILDTYIKNKKDKLKLNLRISGASQNNNSYNSNNINEGNSRNQSPNAKNSLKIINNNEKIAISPIKNNSKLLRDEEIYSKQIKQKQREEMNRLKKTKYK